MELTHGIALFFALAFVIVGTVFQKMLWWLVSIGYLFGLAFVAILNSWELLFFVPIALFAVISVIGFAYSAINGDLI